MGYAIAPDVVDGVLAHLDHREKGGYERRDVLLYLDGDAAPLPALVYLATERNTEYLGPAPLSELAKQIRAARGPSGSNVEYVVRLAEALRALGADDRHVFDLVAAL
jgi:cation transport regulator ChaC